MSKYSALGERKRKVHKIFISDAMPELWLVGKMLSQCLCALDDQAPIMQYFITKKYMCTVVVGLGPRQAAQG